MVAVLVLNGADGRGKGCEDAGADQKHNAHVGFGTGRYAAQAEDGDTGPA